MTETWKLPSIEAEQHIAGCLLVDPLMTLDEIRNIVLADDFADRLCRSIYTACIELSNAGEAIDPVIVQNRIQQNGEVVDTNKLVEIMRGYLTTANVTAHAEIVHNAAQQRRAEAIGLQLAGSGLSVGEAVRSLQELQRGSTSVLKSPKEYMQEYADRVAAIDEGRLTPCLSTGYASLDEVLNGGLVSGGLITLAARPGTGKTSIALNISERIAKAGKTVLYVSLEMPREQILGRRAGIISGLIFGRIEKGTMSDDDRRRLTNAEVRMAGEPFYIHDKPCTVDDVERLVRSLKDVAAVFIDHIGLLKNTSGRTRYEQMTDISHRLKQLALSTGVPIVALCQLNRNCEGRNDKIPTMADLRDTGAIEEDSDVVALLHRPNMYAPEDQKVKSWEGQPFCIIVDKNRHGVQGTVDFTFCGANARILEVPRR